MNIQGVPKKTGIFVQWAIEGIRSGLKTKVWLGKPSKTKLSFKSPQEFSELDIGGSEICISIKMFNCQHLLQCLLAKRELVALISEWKR